MLGVLFSPVQDEVHAMQVPTTSGPLAQPPASASLLDGWQDASLCNSKVIGSSSSTIAGDASVLTHSAAQQAGLQQTLHVSSAFISPECDLGCHNLSDPALHLMENTLAALQQLQLKEHQQQTGGQHEQELQQQYEQQQYEQQQYEQQQRSQAYESQSSSSQWGASATVFFAGVSPIATTEALLGVFAQFGRVMNINLFKPYKGSKTSKGCGLVTFFKPSEAAHALETLNGQFVWPGARTPMVIEWCAPERHGRKQRRQAPRRGRPAYHPHQQQLVQELMPLQHHQSVPPGLCHPLQQQQLQQQQVLPPGLPQTFHDPSALLAVQISQPPAVQFPQPQGTVLLQQQLQQQPQALTLPPELAASLGSGTYAIMRVGP